jgi:hypothetical protein
MGPRNFRQLRKSIGSCKLVRALAMMDLITPVVCLFSQQPADQNANAECDSNRLIRMGAHRMIGLLESKAGGLHASLLQVVA